MLCKLENKTDTCLKTVIKTLRFYGFLYDFFNLINFGQNFSKKFNVFSLSVQQEIFNCYKNKNKVL